MALLRPSFPAVSLSITAAFFLATFVTYGSSLHNRFVSWDDVSLIVDNPIVHSLNLSTVGKAFTSYDPELYVPLTFISYQINHLFAGLDPLTYHLTDLVLHTLNAVFVAWVLWLLIGSGWLALGLGMIFALHPMNTESVAWASARKDTLSTFFFLSSTIAYLYATDSGNKKTYVASIILFALSLLSKVMTVTGPVVLVLLDICRGRPVNLRTLREKIPFALLSLVFGIVGLFGKTEVLESSTLLQKILMASKSTVFYLGKFFWPTQLSVVYPYNRSIALSKPDFFVPLLFVILLVAAAYYLRNRLRTASIAILFVLITLLPTFINFSKGGDVYVASDRYFYLPMVGMLLLIGVFVQRWIRGAQTIRDIHSRPKIVSAVFALVVLACGIITSIQSRVWRDSISLYAHAIELYPDSRAAQNNLGMELLLLGQQDEAITHFYASIAVRDEAHTQMNLGQALIEKGNFGEALRIYRTVLSSHPEMPNPYFGIGHIYQKQGNLDAAAEHYRKAIAIDPAYLNAYINLSAVYVRLKDWPRAIETLMKTIELKPDFVESYYNLGVAYEEASDLKNAEVQYRHTIELSPGDTDALANLATILYAHGTIDEAARYLQRALAIDAAHPFALALLQRMQHDGIVR